MLGAYDWCPYKVKLWLTKVSPTNPVASQMVRGGKIHNIFDKFYDEIDISDVENIGSEREVKQNFYAACKRLSGMTEEEFKDISTDINHFCNFNTKAFLERRQEFMPLKREIKLYSEADDVVGVIDRVDVHDGKIRVIDYKSGYSKGEKTLTNFRMELSIYHYLLKKELNIDADEWGIYFSGDGTLLTEPVKHEHFCSHAQPKIEELKEAIKMDNLPQTTLIQRCNNCEYFDHCWRQ
jgi:CRISPR/Cas system-associated exonuclease Cas4 (RecB family)